MNKKAIGIGIICILIVVGLSGCNEQSPTTIGDNTNEEKTEDENKDNKSPEELIIGTWRRADGRLWTFYDNGSAYKVASDTWEFWLNYEIHNNIMTEYLSYTIATWEIEFEGNNKLILTNSEDDTVVIYHRINDMGS